MKCRKTEFRSQRGHGLCAQLVDFHVSKLVAESLAGDICAVAKDFCTRLCRRHQAMLHEIVARLFKAPATSIDPGIDNQPRCHHGVGGDNPIKLVVILERAHFDCEGSTILSPAFVIGAKGQADPIAADRRKRFVLCLKRYMEMVARNELVKVDGSSLNEAALVEIGTVIAKQS